MDHDPDINPYESPKVPCDVPQVQNRNTFRAILCSFTVHAPAPHEVEIYFSLWTGLEVYAIDGVERLRVRDFRFTVVRQFVIENTAPHQLEIVIKAFPWVRGHVSLDGQPIIDDLFPMQRTIGLWGWSIVLVLALVAAALIVVLLRLRGMPPVPLSL